MMFTLKCVRSILVRVIVDKKTHSSSRSVLATAFHLNRVQVMEFHLSLVPAMGFHLTPVRATLHLKLAQGTRPLPMGRHISPG